MGHYAGDVAAAIIVGNPGDKAVLNALARRCCKDCGLTWAGVRALGQDTEMSESRIRQALKALTDVRQIVAVRYPRGGRGLTTEYVVLPYVVELSTAPCERCVENMRNPPPRGAFAKVVGEKPPGYGPFTGLPGGKPSRLGAENPPQSTTHPEENTHPEGNAARSESETSLSLGSAFDHPSDDPMGRQAAKDALRAVEALSGPETRPKP